MTGTLDHIVVAGGSVAGISAARELRRLEFAGQITVIDADPRAPYRRPEVSKSFLSAAPEPTALRVGDNFPVTTVRGRITALNLPKREVRVDGTKVAPFDGLVIATGAVARTIDDWDQMDSVHCLRDHDDAARLREQLRGADKLTVIGGGFIGLEVAAKAVSMGLQVVVVEGADLPLARVAAPPLSRHVMRLLERRGVEFRCAESVSKLEEHGGRTLVHLAGGETLTSNLVVLAIGARPATEWLEGSGISALDGVNCDETCAVMGCHSVVAAGDVAAWINPLFGRRMRVEHWTNAMEQGAYAARRLLGRHDPEGFASVPYFWSTQTDVKIECVGSTALYDEHHVLVEQHERMIVSYGLNGRLVALAGVGATREVARAKRMILAGMSMDDPALATIIA